MAGGRERHDGAHAKFGGFLQGKFKGVKLHDGEKQRRLQGRLLDQDFFDKRKPDTVALHFFHAREPNAIPITQFVDLAQLGSKDAAKMMCRLTFHDRAVPIKLFNEKSPAHGGILTQSSTVTHRPPCQSSSRRDAKGAGVRRAKNVVRAGCGFYGCTKTVIIGTIAQAMKVKPEKLSKGFR